MRHAIATTTIAIAAVTLTACGGNNAESPTEPVAQQTVDIPAEPVEQLSPRGAIIKTVGEPAGIRGTYGENSRAFEFTVTNLDAEVVCEPDDYGRNKPENGRWVLLEFEVETFDTAPTYPMLGKYDFYSVTDDGFIEGVGESVGDFCLSEASWDGVYTPKPNSKYEVAILLDVPLDATMVGYEWKPGTVPVASWEWELPTV